MEYKEIIHPSYEECFRRAAEISECRVRVIDRWNDGVTFKVEATPNNLFQLGMHFEIQREMMEREGEPYHDKQKED